MPSTENNDDSTDGAHHSSKVFHEKNMVLKNNLDVSNWWTALQDDSILASYDADCLQHIFARLAVLDALPLGFTCRRLYYHFKESQKKTRALKINLDISQYSFQKDVYLISSFRSVASKFVATFTSLRSLMVSTNLNPNNFKTLLTQLKSLPLLTTLTLNASNYDYFQTFKLLDFFWLPLAQLQQSSLRHLTINLEQNTIDQYEIPPLPILRQLTSITFEYTGPDISLHHKVIEALSKEQYGVHLTPGVGACIGLALFKYDKRSLVSVQPALLPFITFLDVSLGWQIIPFDKLKKYKTALASLIGCLPKMRNLKKIKLQLDLSMILTDYPSFIGALTTLTQLRELSIKMNWSNYKNHRLPVWSSTDMPVLSRVRDLSLEFWSRDHTDVVKQLHLAQCFPGLRQLWCFFKHSSECKEHNGNPQYHICGQELTRGLVELMPETIVKTIEFKFDDKFYFSSLENLLDDNKRKEQLEVADRKLLKNLSSLDRKPAELKAENELIKRQLAQIMTDRLAL